MMPMMVRIRLPAAVGPDTPSNGAVSSLSYLSLRDTGPGILEGAGAASAVDAGKSRRGNDVWEWARRARGVGGS